MAASAPLVCPSCGTGHGAEERFCGRCGMPLVLADATRPPLTERQERARKVSPQFTEGGLVKVGWARNQAEAELIAGLLLEEGIPSIAKRSGGFDVPDFLAAGPRDILVAAAGADAARDDLGARPDAPRIEREPTPAWVRGLALLLVVVTAGLVLAGVAVAVFQ